MPAPHAGTPASALHLFDDRGIDRSTVTTLAKNLRRHRDADIDAALEAERMPARIQHWVTILAHLDGVPGIEPVDAWRLLTEHPCLLVAELEPFCTALVVRSGIRWRTLVEIYEACYRLALARTVPGVTEHEATQAIGLLCRSRWLLLSAPYDPRFMPPTALGDRDTDEDPGLDADFLSAARNARDEWLTVLAEIEDHPRLAAALGDAEDELSALTETRIEKQGYHGRTSPDSTHAAITDFVVTRLLLPRFAWKSAFNVVRRTSTRAAWHLAGIGALAAAAFVCFLLAALTSWHHGYTVAAAMSAFGYAGIAAGSLHRRALGWLCLLRQPASAAVGLLALAAMPADWWWNDARAGGTALRGPLLQATITLAAVGAGYLAVEVVNHSARGRKAVLRSAAVTITGLVHAFMVSLIAMRWIVPAFTAAPEKDPAGPSCWWSAAGCGPHAIAPWLVVVAATAWSFVTGVFLQILWDDQPITAPLTHVTWRHGR